MPLVTFTVTRDAGYENFIDFTSNTGSQPFTMGPDGGTFTLNLPEGTTYTLRGRSNQSSSVLWRRDSPTQVGLEDSNDGDYNDLQVSVNTGSFSLSGSDVLYEASSVSILSFTVNRNTIQLGESVTFTWSSTGGTRANINTAPVTPNSGNYTVTPTVAEVNGSWTLRVDNDVGQYDTATLLITVTAPPLPPAPTVSLTLGATSITAGSSTTLTWSTTNTVTSISWSPSAPNGNSNYGGSESVSPTSTTVYIVTVSGPGGTATATVTLTVNQIPIVTLTPPSPAILAYGTQGRIDYTAEHCNTGLSITPTYNYSNGPVSGTIVTIPPSASRITGFITTVIPYTAFGPTSVSYRIDGFGSGGSATISVPITITIDEEPDFFVIPSRLELIPSQADVITPDPLGPIPIPILTITGVDIPVEITANAQIQVSINGGAWLNIRQSP